MKLSDCVTPDHILTDLQAAGNEEAIAKMVDALFPASGAVRGGVGRETVLETLLARERLQTTALGMGIACPHARIAGFKGFALSIGISREGIPFGSSGGEPVNIILLLISSLSKPYVQLRAMRVLIQYLEQEDNRALVMTGSPEEIWRSIDAAGLEITDQVLAHDLMRKVDVRVTPEISIGDAAHLMHVNNLSNLPVVDGEGVYQGFISSIHLFRVGVPQFFQNLKTVSFVRNLDPFERYFASRHKIKVGDIREEGGSIDKDATLLEIVFQIAVKEYSELYVLGEGKLLGVIDNYRLIDRVLTL